MPWSGWPIDACLAADVHGMGPDLAAGREVLWVTTLLSYLGVWHVFGDDKWVWFNGVIRRQQRRDRDCQTVGGKPRIWASAIATGAGSTGVIRPLRPCTHHHASCSRRRSTIATCASQVRSRGRNASGQSPTSPRRTSMASASSRPAMMTTRTATGTTTGDGGRDETDMIARHSRRGIVPGIALRALEGQRLQTIELTGDDRFLPIEELDTRSTVSATAIVATRARAASAGTRDGASAPPGQRQPSSGATNFRMLSMTWALYSTPS